MFERYMALKGQTDGNLDALYTYMRNLFSHDDWVVREYAGGLNNIQFADDHLKNVIELIETAVAISNQVSVLLLERVRDAVGDIRYHAGTVFSNRFDLSSSNEYLEEKNVVFMAKDLAD